jgi:hypothetical protein
MKSLPVYSIKKEMNLDKSFFLAISVALEEPETIILK